ncbi:substrate-binding domain-containing protein [Halanaerobium salsuginis]|uniref:Monosaccharide ABC transporter substrate-binding protein, CUT2 family (TC 3.A.1.2.-) n=1 Tax=Halanaerobium salsuginis TaxID=29563 RepID=A0A1I4JCC0_9FIRM|nr:substrate-binding domain-containing protein [Halanaerobium salsuginis]SFL64218.1 monosaccharide ABC transporter substrate-binding protein, CUT2 family (TC 3.A.1.2.-) [Halanaerobium salsuginis]
MKKLLVLMMVLVLSLSFIGTVAAQDDTPLKGDPDDEYVMVTFVSGIEYWKPAYRGMEDAAKNLGVSTRYTGANDYDINQQVTVLEQVISQNPAGILLTCINPDALAGPINRAMEAGIPVVTFDADAPDSDRYSFLATSNYEAGVTAANYLAELNDEKGDLGLITIPGQLNHEERAQGFEETIANNYPDMEVVSIQDGQSDQAASARAMGSMIQANPDLVGVFTTEASTGVGAATAVKEADMVDSIDIVSFDTDKGTLDYVKDGIIDATLAQGTWNMGYWGQMFLFHLNEGLLNPIGDGDWKEAGINPLPNYVDTGVNLVTKDNVDFYYGD